MTRDAAPLVCTSYESMACAVCPLFSDGICHNSSVDRGAQGSAVLRRVSVSKGQQVFDSELSKNQAFVVRSGILCVQQYTRQGRHHVLSLILPDEVVGIGRRQEGLSVAAATDCVLCKIDLRVLERHLERYSSARRAVYQKQQDQLERLRWLTWAVGALTPDERVCAFLVQAIGFMPYQVQDETSGMLTMRLSRADIADMLCTSVETISRVTHKLQEDGILVILNPEVFLIRDMPGLCRRGRVNVAPRSMTIFSGGRYCGDGPRPPVGG